VYIHLDLDALNPADFPDTLMRTPGGPSLADIRAAISSLAARFDVAGFSIVEYVPGSAESLRVLGDLLTCAGVAGAARPIC
jgi:arginase